GAGGWGTASHHTTCYGIRIRGDQPPGQIGVHLYANGSGNNLAFIHTWGAAAQVRYYGVRLSEINNGYVTGNKLDITTTACVRAWELTTLPDDPIEDAVGLAVSGNQIWTQVQTTPPTERAMVLLGRARSNKILGHFWD